MGLLITLGILLALGLIPLGISVCYRDEKLILKIKVLGISFDLPKGKKEKSSAQAEKPPVEEKKPLPPKKAEKQALKEAKQQVKDRQIRDENAHAKQQAAKKETPKKKKDFSIYLPFLRLGLDLLGSLRRKLRVEKLYGKVILAGDDPCDLASAYGRAWAGVSNLMAYLNQILVIQDQDINIECDFAAEKTLASGRLDLTITLGRALGLAVCYGFRALREYLIFKKRKGGATI